MVTQYEIISHIMFAYLCVGSGYKVSELASLTEGESLMIGGKEIEVMGVISAADFAKGRCFQEVQVEVEEPHTKTAPPPRHFVSKPFCPPTAMGRAEPPGSKLEEEQKGKPRHDPLAPGMWTESELIYCNVPHSGVILESLSTVCMKVSLC